MVLFNGSHGVKHLAQLAGILFGPDVSEEFCQDNNLLCLIRSHEAGLREQQT
jgi:hypothetical protein